MRRENNAQHYQLALDALLLLAIGLAFFFFVVTTRTGQNVAFGDNTWYLNRADLLWRGIRDDAYVYNIVFPLLTGIVNFVLRDLVVSGMVVELVALYGIAVGTYILGRMLYSRRVGLLAAIVVSANPELYNGARYFGGDILFVNTVLWCILGSVLLMRRPNLLTAALLSILILVAMYTRFEGIVYAVLLLVAVAYICWSRRDRRLSLQMLVVAGLIIGTGAAFYMSVFAGELTADSNASLALLRMVKTIPFRGDLVSNRITDTLVDMLALWPVWSWWIVCAVVLWGTRVDRTKRLALFGIVVLNPIYIFLLAGWPFKSYLVHYLPCFALLYVAAIFAFVPRRWQLVAVPALILAIALPGLIAVAQYMQTPPLDFRTSQLANDGIAVDQWVVEHGWQNTMIYTLCGQIVPFSRSHLYLIYRLAAGFHSDKNWNSPHQLIPHMRQTGELLLTCQTPIYFADWKDYFERPGAYPDQLLPVGQTGVYTFYRAK